MRRAKCGRHRMRRPRKSLGQGPLRRNHRQLMKPMIEATDRTLPAVKKSITPPAKTNFVTTPYKLLFYHLVMTIRRSCWSLHLRHFRGWIDQCLLRLAQGGKKVQRLVDGQLAGLWAGGLVEVADLAVLLVADGRGGPGILVQID